MRRLLLAANVLALLGLAAVMIAVAGFGWNPIQANATPAAPAVALDPHSKVAVFNMAVVMKDYGKARYKVYKLNEAKKNKTIELVELKGRSLKIQHDIDTEQNPRKKEELTDKHRVLTRQYEDLDRKITKQMNAEASAIIIELYDDIKEAVDKIASAKGFDIVFTYPDATSAEEFKSAYVKELKLKPPAAQPFFVADQVELTDEVLKELNSRHPSPPVPEGEHSGK